MMQTVTWVEMGLVDPGLTFIFGSRLFGQWHGSMDQQKDPRTASLKRTR